MGLGASAARGASAPKGECSACIERVFSRARRVPRERRVTERDIDMVVVVVGVVDAPLSRRSAFIA
jgi:hypothetical protein